MRYGLCCLLATAVGALSCLAGETRQVGDFGDLRRLEIRGAETFSADELRDALRMDADIQYAAHDTAPLEELLAAIESFLREGYMAKGFADPSAQAAVDPQRGCLVVTLVEGARYTQGEMQVAGDDQEAVQAVENALADPPADDAQHLDLQAAGEDDQVAQHLPHAAAKKPALDLPVWKKGQHVQFGTNRRLQEWQAGLETILLDSGRIGARCELQIRRNESTNTADLMVRILDAGRKLSVDRIEIEGLERNSRESFLKVVGAHKAMALDVRKFSELERRLYESGRFAEHRLSLNHDPVADKVTLRANVTELPQVPLLGAPVTQRQQAALRAGEWLGDWQRHAAVLHGSAQAGEANEDWKVEFVLENSGRLLAAVDGRHRQLAFSYLFSVSSGELAVFNRSRQRSYLAAGLRAGGVKAQFKPEITDGDLRIRFNFAGQSGASQRGLSLDFAPALMLLIATSEKAQWAEQDDGQVAVTFRRSTITFDPATGQVSQLTARPHEDGAEFRVSFAPLSQNKLLEARDQLVRDCVNEHDANQPLAALVGFCVGEVVWNSRTVPQEQASRRADVISGLVAQQLAPIFATSKSGDQEGRALERFSSRPSIPFTTNYSATLAAWGPGLADSLFPRRSWPWVVLREVAFVVRGRTDYAGKEIDALLRDANMGPLGCLCVAKLLSRAKQDLASQMFAGQGIARLSLEDFRKDLRLLTTGDQGAAKLVRAAVDLFGSLTAEEVEALCSFLDPAVAKEIEAFHNQLGFDDRPATEIVNARLEALWSNGGRERVKRALMDFFQ